MTIIYHIMVQYIDCFQHSTHNTTMRSSASCQTIHLSASRFPTPICIFLQVSLGTVKQCEMALSRITASLSFFIHEYKQLASYRAQVDRLYDFRCCGLAFMKDCDPDDICGHCGHAMKHKGGCPSLAKQI